MLSKLSDCLYISSSFDESSNSLVQKGQMDVIRFWDSETNCVPAPFLGSEFMGKSTAENILQTLLAGISDLHQSDFSDCVRRKVMWKFLQEVPTRSSLFENILESLDYPFQFCGHRWRENQRSAEIAEMILEGYHKFITHTCSLREI